MNGAVAMNEFFIRVCCAGVHTLNTDRAIEEGDGGLWLETDHMLAGVGVGGEKGGGGEGRGLAVNFSARGLPCSGEPVLDKSSPDPPCGPPGPVSCIAVVSGFTIAPTTGNEIVRRLVRKNPAGDEKSAKGLFG